MGVKEFDNFVPVCSTGEGMVIKKRNLENSKLSPIHLLLSVENRMKDPKTKFDQQWKVFRSRSIEWWSLLAEHDLKKVDKADDKQNKFVTLLQVKYGYTRQQAQAEINNRWMAFYMARKVAG